MICPHCERDLEGHSDADCRRRMSRRVFFGICVAPLAATMAGQLARMPTKAEYRAALREALPEFARFEDHVRLFPGNEKILLGARAPGKTWANFLSISRALEQGRTAALVSVRDGDLQVDDIRNMEDARYALWPQSKQT